MVASLMLSFDAIKDMNCIRISNAIANNVSPSRQLRSSERIILFYPFGCGLGSVKDKNSCETQT